MKTTFPQLDIESLDDEIIRLTQHDGSGEIALSTFTHTNCNLCLSQLDCGLEPIQNRRHWLQGSPGRLRAFKSASIVLP